MPKETSVKHLFHASWEDTTRAFWSKYSHPKFSHVKDSLVIFRQVDANGLLRSKRLIHVRQPVPEVFRPLTSLDSYFAVEETTLDLQKKTLSLESENITFSSIVKAKERCVYRQMTDDPSKTEYIANVEVVGQRNIPILTNRVERALISQGTTRINNGVDIMKSMLTEGRNEEHVDVSGNIEPSGRLGNVLTNSGRRKSGFSLGSCASNMA